MSKGGTIVVGVLIVVEALLLVGVVFAWMDQHGAFEYTTISGETGIASFCTASYGQPRCRTADGTTLMVERYTKK